MGDDLTAELFFKQDNNDHYGFETIICLICFEILQGNLEL